MYLLNPIPYEKKYALVNELHKKFPNKIGGYLNDMPIGVRGFFGEYFFETLHRYNEDGKYTAKRIYGIIKHFKKYYDEYASIRFSPLTSNKKAVDSKDEKRMQKLTNEIFSVYIDDNLDAMVDQPLIIHNFQHFYHTYPTDKNTADILLSKMSDSNSSETNQILFRWGYNFYSRATIKNPRIDSIAKAYGLSGVLHNLRNPEKQKWEIEHEKQVSEERKKKRETLAKYEKHFSAHLHDNAKPLALQDLHFISQFVFKDIKDISDAPLEKKTFEKLKQLLKQKIRDDLISPDLLTIKSLAESSPYGFRDIDIVYYSSLALHNDWDTEDFENDIHDKSDFYDYLYISCLMKKGISGVIPTNFSDVVENKYSDRANQALTKFIGLLFQKYIQDNITNMLLRYIINHIQEYGIEEIKHIVSRSYSTNQSTEDIGEELLYEWLSTFNLSVTLDDLRTLAAGTRNGRNAKSISALVDIIEDNKQSFNVNKAIEMHGLLFDTFPSTSKNFFRLSSELKIRVIDYMLDQFNSPQALQSKKTTGNDIATPITAQENCIFFLQQRALYELEFNELKKLKDMRRNNKEDIWKNYIDRALPRMQQIKSDKEYTPLNIAEMKAFMLNNEIVSHADFLKMSAKK